MVNIACTKGGILICEDLFVWPCVGRQLEIRSHIELGIVAK
jgi:hypothetical protein